MAKPRTVFTLVDGGRAGNIYRAGSGTRALLAVGPQSGTAENHLLGDPGVYCFLPELPHDVESFYRAVARDRAHFPGFIEGRRVQFLAWIAEPKKISPTQQALAVRHVVQIALDTTPGTTLGPLGFRLGNATLRIPAGARVDVDDTGSGFVLSGEIALVPTADDAPEVPVARVELPVSSDGAQGIIEFDLSLGEAGLDALDVGLRYAFAADGADRSQRYPVFSLAEGEADIALRARLDPFRESDPGETLYTFTDGVSAVSSYLRSTHGLPIALTAAATGTPGAPRLVFTPKPGEAGAVYLAPIGPFVVGHGAPARARDRATRTIHLMGGLSGGEFLRLAPADTLTFVGDRPAYAENFTPPSASGSRSGSRALPAVPTLTDRFTTSWVRTSAAAGASGGESGGDDPSLGRGYCVQPRHSTYYQSSDLGYPFAAGALVSPLAHTPPLPLVPYAGVVCDEGTGGTTSCATLAALERQVIGPSRRAAVDVDRVVGPVFFDPVTDVPSADGFARTPRGLLVALNGGGEGEGPPGTWKRLTLASSPVIADHALVIGTAGAELEPPGHPPANPRVVSPSLSNALMNDELFMVVSEPTFLGDFTRNEIRLGDFTFVLDVGPQATLLLFKFTTEWSVSELVAEPGLWDERELFVGEANVEDVSTRIARYIEDAARGGDLFDDFNALVANRSWTGILALNCGLDGAAFPPDIQNLLGGVEGELRARYFGVTLNRIDDDGPEWTVDRSSLFGLIHYTSDFDLPVGKFGFEVLRLDALFVNSALSRFDARIAVTIPELYKAKVTLSSEVEGDRPDVNGVVIAGVYQVHDGQGSVVFDTSAPRLFTVAKPGSGLRVLERVHVEQMSLVAHSSSADATSGATTVISALVLAGRLDFAPDVSPAGIGTDLFSYGDAADAAVGLAFSAYALRMTTVIEDGVGTLESIVPFYADTELSGAGIVPRAGSLLAALPLKVAGFASVGLERATAGAVNVVGGYRIESGEDDTEPVLTASVPDFALSLKLSLGSPGALSSLTDSLGAEVLLGWKAGADGATGDRISMWLVPPTALDGMPGFAIEGVLGSTYERVRLLETVWPQGAGNKVFVLQLLDVQVRILGIALLGDDTTTNFTLFADPEQGGAGNLGWLLTARAPQLPDG